MRSSARSSTLPAHGSAPRTAGPLRRLLAVGASAGLLGVGLAGAATIAAPAAHAAAPAVSDVRCDGGPTRLLQLSDGDASTGYSTLSGSSVGNAAGTSPQYYSWQRIPLSFTARAVAVREQREIDGRAVTFAYVTSTDGDLYLVRWDPGATTSADKVITRRLTTSGTYAFHRLAWDGTRLWGIKGADLYFIGTDGDSPYAEVTGQQLVKADFGYPRTFHGVFGGSDEIAYSDSDGALYYADITGLGTSNKKVTSTKVAASGWGNSANAFLGGGLVYRIAGANNDLLRRQTIREGSSGYTVSDYQTVATGIVAPNERLSAAPDSCQVVAPDPEPTPASGFTDIALRYVGQQGTAACQDANSTEVTGECKQFVNCVATLAGQRPPVSGYYEGYLNNGYVKVSKSAARRGDIVQVYDPSATYSPVVGIHTAILLEPFGADNAVQVVDSNYVSHWQVGIHSFDPYARAASKGLAVAIWRYNG